MLSNEERLYHAFRLNHYQLNQDEVKHRWKLQMQQTWNDEFKVGEYKNFTYFNYKNIYEKELSVVAAKDNTTSIEQEEVTYKINQYNFRGALTFDDIDTVKSVAIGDSWTMGEGVPEDKTFVSLLNTPTVNLGMSGASLDSICRLSIAVLNNFNLEHMFITIPDLARLEFIGLEKDREVTKAAGPYSISLQVPKRNQTKTINKYKDYIDYADEYDMWVRAYKSIKIINSIATKKNVRVYYSSWSKAMHGKIEEICAPKPCYLDYRIDRARDGLHPGVYTHLKLAYNFNGMAKLTENEKTTI